jgi:hypothetical protein
VLPSLYIEEVVAQLDQAIATLLDSLIDLQEFFMRGVG